MGDSGPVDLLEVAAAIDAGRVHWRMHVAQRMAERGIGRADVVDVLRSGEIIEDYADDAPFPSALVLGFDGDRPLHVVVALDAERGETYIITVYEPSPNRFEPDWRTRRSE